MKIFYVRQPCYLDKSCVTTMILVVQEGTLTVFWLFPMLLVRNGARFVLNQVSYLHL